MIKHATFWLTTLQWMQGSLKKYRRKKLENTEMLRERGQTFFYDELLWHLGDTCYRNLALSNSKVRLREELVVFTTDTLNIFAVTRAVTMEAEFLVLELFFIWWTTKHFTCENISACSFLSQIYRRKKSICYVLRL